MDIGNFDIAGRCSSMADLPSQTAQLAETS